GRIAVLKGGSSLERQVSLRSAARVQDALERLSHDVVPVDVGGDLVERLRAEAPDAAFIALHGVGGEDGTVQELLEILGIPYTGSGVLACMRSMDKVLAKHLLLAAGIPTPEFFAFNETAFQGLGAAAALPAIGRTTFVCPAELPEPITARAHALAVATYDLLGCHGVARVDIMLEEATSELFVLETNVIPGMTDTSLLPQAAEAAGIGFEALVERMLELAFERAAGRTPV